MMPEIKTEQSGDEYIEPVTSIWDGGKKYHIVTEIPDVSEEKIRIDLEHNHLIIYASNSERRYKKEIIISDQVRLGTKKFNDGILQITLDKIGT